MADRGAFIEPIRTTQRQVLRVLQTFRDGLSDRTMAAFGVPLRTTEAELRMTEPAVADVRAGRVFDRNWELLSPVAPVGMVKRLVRSHFHAKLPRIVSTNLSRLAAQWEQSINAALFAMEAERRLDELMRTVEQLVESGTSDRAPEIQADLDRLEEARAALARSGTSAGQKGAKTRSDAH